MSPATPDPTDLPADPDMPSTSTNLPADQPPAREDQTQQLVKEISRLEESN